jgi:hypothetical protein
MHRGADPCDALGAAAYTGNFPLFQELYTEAIRRGLSESERRAWLNSSLIRAAEGRCAELVGFLLKNGADVNFRSPERGGQYTALIAASEMRPRDACSTLQQQTLKIILAYKPNLGVHSGPGDTALRQARAFRRDNPCAQMLRNAGAPE